MKTKALLLLSFITSFTLFSQDYKFGKVSKEELLEKEYALEPNADAAVLFREYTTKFEYSSEEGFYLVTNVFERRKIFTKEGFEFATVKINLRKSAKKNKEELTGLKANTFYLDNSGKIVKVKLKNSIVFDKDIHKYLAQKIFTFPDVKEGSIVEYKYTITSPFTTDIEPYVFQETIPVKNASLTFMVPEYLVYKPHVRGWINLNLQTQSRDRSLTYSYTKVGAVNGGGADKSIKQTLKFIENITKTKLKNIPSFKKESYSGSIKNYLSSIQFELAYTKFPNSPFKNFTTDWNSVSKRIYESSSFGSELKKTSFFEKDINSLINGLNTNEKIITIFEFVKNRMNWNNYIGKYTNKGIKKAYKEKVGNVAEINLLLTSILRYAGIDANPVLVSTKGNGIPLFPTINGFNYVIVAVTDSNKLILFDATDKLNEVNTLDSELFNWKGRLIRKDGSSDWVQLTPTTHSVKSYLINSKITNQKEINGEVKIRYTGQYALISRKKYSELQTEEIKSNFEEKLGATEISNIVFENLNTLYKPVNLSYTFNNNDVIEVINDKIILTPTLFLSEKENPFKLETRNYPVDFEFPFKQRYMVNIEIPEGYSIESKPENTSLSFGNKDAIFRYILTEQNNKIQLSYELSINTPFVDPQNYPNLKEFYKILIEKENEKIVLSKQ